MIEIHISFVDGTDPLVLPFAGKRAEAQQQAMAIANTGLGLGKKGEPFTFYPAHRIFEVVVGGEEDIVQGVTLT